MVKRLLLVSLAGVGFLCAESAAEKALRLQLEAARAERAEMVKTLAALQAQVAHVTAAAAKTAVVASKTAATATKDATEAAGAKADNNTKLADKTEEVAAAAKASAAAVEAAAVATHGQNSALLIVQMFALMALLVNIGYQVWTRIADHHWAVEASEKAAASVALSKEVLISTQNIKADVRQVHTLVNSNITGLIGDVLSAKQEALALTLAALDAQRKNGEEPNDSALANVATKKAEISGLQALLKERGLQTAVAAAQLLVDTRIPSLAPDQKLT